MSDNTKKVYVVGPQQHYASFITNCTLVDNIKEADIVIFTGGEDVDPSLYNETPYSNTYSNLERDLKEMKEFKKCTPKQLVVGICRGSQFLCVMNGGKLVQDVTNHSIYGTHLITNKTFSYSITSTHHQMQYPYNLPKEDYDVLFVSYQNTSSWYYGGGIDTKKIIMYGEPEIVVYHKKDLPTCLAIQGHPEMMRKEAPVVKLINTIIKNLSNSLTK